MTKASKPKDRRIRWWEWHDGSLVIPARVDITDGSAVYRAPRFLLDWNDPYAPRRLYYYGKRISWTQSLEPGAGSQVWSWRHRWWTERYRAFSVHPTNYRRIARTPPWMKRHEHVVRDRPPSKLQHLVTTRFSSEDWKMLCDATEGLDRGVVWYVRQAALDAARRGWTGPS